MIKNMQKGKLTRRNPQERGSLKGEGGMEALLPPSHWTKIGEKGPKEWNQELVPGHFTSKKGSFPSTTCSLLQNTPQVDKLTLPGTQN